MGLGEVPQLEVDQACEEREAALDRKLKDWERKLVKAYLTNQKLKELTPEERLSIPDFEFPQSTLNHQSDLLFSTVQKPLIKSS